MYRKEDRALPNIIMTELRVKITKSKVSTQRFQSDEPYYVVLKPIYHHMSSH